MSTTSAIRMRRMRERRRFGMQFVTAEISEEAIKLLEKQGYLETRIASLDGAGDHGVAIGLVLDAA